MSIKGQSTNPTIKFAGEELSKYLSKMGNKDNEIVLKGEGIDYTPEDNSIWIGLFSDFGIESQGVEDSNFDDELHIDINRGKGIIAGVNPRSVLLAVYRFLAEAGCMWVRPGEDGEFIPEKDILSVSVDLHEKASYRHRGICIEGANSYQNIVNIVDWAPKVGFNAYYFQFREAYIFFERWYTHRNNPLKPPEPFTVDMARGFLRDAEKEIEKRGLIYHAVGHGWTCEPFGIQGLSWDTVEEDIDPEIRKYLAKVDGERKLWHGVPLNTNLCYSNPKVRDTIIKDIVSYAKEHPQIDVLQFWLADGSNNQCECEGCQEKRPSDFYVMMLNRLDERLTEEELDVKIVFLIYVDLLWAPESERIKNPDRFILMFAPITRTYSSTFSADGELPAIPPYERNKLKFSSKVEDNLALLKSWQDIFDGDSFDFDYHFMWDHYLDPGYYKVAEILSADIKNLQDIGLNGYLSCQTQRAFFPTGLSMYVMGRTLWDANLEFDDLVDEYFETTFGQDWQDCRDYLSRMSELFDPPYLRGEKERVSEEAAKRFSDICVLIEDFREIIDRNLDSSNPCHAASWRYLNYHSDIACLLALALEARAQDKLKKANSIWKLTKKYVQEKEDELQSVFDVFLFITTVESRLGFK